MAAVVAAIGFQGSVLAQAPWDNLSEPASYVSIGVGDSGWTLFPIITAEDDFVGFFGYLPSELVVGDNVSLLWLVPDSGDGSWSMYGWLDDDLKTASDYLDGITGQHQVLSVTGLELLFQEDQPLVEPASMPYGIIDEDPASAIVEASQDPEIADILVTVGAGGAPSLTKAINLQPTCPPAVVAGDGGHLSELDSHLALSARGVQEMMVVWVSDDILDSIEIAGYGQDDYPNGDGSQEAFVCCPPLTFTTYGPWSAWSCTGGPSQGVGTCTYTGCTRTRPSYVNLLLPNCTTISYQGPNQTQGPQTEVLIVPGGTECPPSP
jgi:hypothetical protein